jgi:hypothetical protein
MLRIKIFLSIIFNHRLEKTVWLGLGGGVAIYVKNDYHVLNRKYNLKNQVDYKRSLLVQGDSC